MDGGTPSRYTIELYAGRCLVTSDPADLAQLGHNSITAVHLKGALKPELEGFLDRPVGRLRARDSIPLDREDTGSHLRVRGALRLNGDNPLYDGLMVASDKLLTWLGIALSNGGLRPAGRPSFIWGARLICRPGTEAWHTDAINPVSLIAVVTQPHGTELRCDELGLAYSTSHGDVVALSTSAWHRTPPGCNNGRVVMLAEGGYLRT